MPPDRYRGYTSFGSENLANSLDAVAPPDLKESFSIGPFNHSYDEYHFGQTGSRFFDVYAAKSAMLSLPGFCFAPFTVLTMRWANSPV